MKTITRVESLAAFLSKNCIIALNGNIIEKLAPKQAERESVRALSNNYEFFLHLCIIVALFHK